ncbi:MAG: acetate kinase [Flavobacteriaceae bacterium]|nr:acetate kinase [Flavobacteriaceae bacterium]
MKILVINSGSSSIKYQLFNMPEQKVICSGLIERVGLEMGKIHYKYDGKKIEEETPIPNHKVGLEKVVNLLLDKEVGVISSTDEIKAVGHRVVHGGNKFTSTVVVNEEVKKEIKSLFSLAPLHNPPNLEGIEVCEGIFTKAKQVAVFDTAFHQTMPEKSHRYAIPTKLYKEENIRVYGFHGTSHKYVSQEANKYLGKENSKIITVHLGNGCSITAVENGKSIDHSLGFGPVNGLIMGTRSGDIDHEIIFYLIEKLGYTPEQVKKMFQKESGMYGLTGYSDLRDIEENAEKGDPNCQLALELNTYRVKKYIGAYTAIMNGLDAIVFTAGIGENSDVIRRMVCSDLEYLGVELDEEKNNVRAKELTEIHKPTSKVKVIVIPTNEELEIAKQSFEVL